jgi:hypothetical protein
LLSITGHDGSCLFRSTAVIFDPKLLESIVEEDSKTCNLRNKIADTMRNSPGEYFSFVEVDRLKVDHSHFFLIFEACMSDAEKKTRDFMEEEANRLELFFRYCDALETREDDDNMYGGYAEIVAISKHFETPIYVIRLDDPGIDPREINKIERVNVR